MLNWHCLTGVPKAKCCKFHISALMTFGLQAFAKENWSTQCTFLSGHYSSFAQFEPGLTKTRTAVFHSALRFPPLPPQAGYFEQPKNLPFVPLRSTIGSPHRAHLLKFVFPLLSILKPDGSLSLCSPFVLPASSLTSQVRMGCRSAYL